MRAVATIEACSGPTYSDTQAVGTERSEHIMNIAGGVGALAPAPALEAAAPDLLVMTVVLRADPPGVTS